MKATPLPLVDLASLTHAHIGYRDDSQHGREAYDKYVALRKQYAGMVVAVYDNEKYESRGWDDGDTVYRRTVWVFDGVATKMFDTDVAEVGYKNGRATAWAVDASPETMAAYYKWLLTISLPTRALENGERAKAQHIADAEAEATIAANPTLAKGQTYKVVRGRKVPHGTTGKVFWFGDKGWGMSVGLSTSDRKDPRGRNLDVVFVALKNLEYVPDATTANAVAAATASRADADAVGMRVAMDWYKNAVEEWIATTGYDRDSVRERVIQVLTSIVSDNTCAPAPAQSLALAAMVAEQTA
jgi:hypothetical protein